MVLDGRITLSHNEKRKVTLEIGDQDRFTGDEITKSKGGCVDFNLMLKEGADGNLFYRRLQPGMKINLNDFSIKGKPDLRDGSYFGVYLVKGKVSLSKCHKVDRILLKDQDFCMFREGENLGAWDIKGEKDSEVVLVQIFQQE